jgi:competence/damage-inducible protein CinA-like protein
LTRLRAAVVVTGTELVRGDRNDLNGPFLARELHRLGLEPARVSIVGDRPEELETALADGLEADLCVVSGGLGPTHDDRTVEVLARVAGRKLEVDRTLEEEIELISRRVAERLRRPYGEFASGVRKQASLPEGAISLGLAGTAPGIVLDTGRCAVVALPGPPNELRRLWAQAVEAEPVRKVLEQARPPERRVLRFFGLSESAVARVLAETDGEGSGAEVTVCARDFEVHVDIVGGGEELVEGLREELRQYLFAEDERPVAEIVLDLCKERRLTLAAAESCTGGLVGTMLTSVPGSSDVFLGGVVAYSDQVKHQMLGVPTDILERRGAVSAETAAAMSAGARALLRADVAVAVTGIAGPGGGTAEKPVGLVYIHAQGPEGGRGLDFVVPGDRDLVRRRAAVSALHLVRLLLAQSRDESA